MSFFFVHVFKNIRTLVANMLCVCVMCCTAIKIRFSLLE